MCGSVGYGAHAPWLVIDRERQEVCVRGKQREAVCLCLCVYVAVLQARRQDEKGTQAACDFFKQWDAAGKKSPLFSGKFMKFKEKQLNGCHFYVVVCVFTYLKLTS